MRAEVTWRGLCLVAEFDYMPGDDETGWPDDVDLISVWPEGVEETPDTNILPIISADVRFDIEADCMESYKTALREAVEDVPDDYRSAA